MPYVHVRLLSLGYESEIGGGRVSDHMTQAALALLEEQMFMVNLKLTCDTGLLNP